MTNVDDPADNCLPVLSDVTLFVSTFWLKSEPQEFYTLYIMLYYSLLYYIILCYVILYYIILLCYIILYYIVLYYIILYYIILYIILYYIILYFLWKIHSTVPLLGCLQFGISIL